VSAERIVTVYPCIDVRFSRVVKEEDVQTFRQQRGLAEGFLLYLGTLEPRKNITTLLEAYARLRQTRALSLKLVLAGGKGWLYDSIFARVKQLGLETEVLFPGFVPDEEQLLWYHAASVFLYPSLYEGFGIPVAEALACGIPVVTSNVSSLPEAGAGMALTVDPHDVEAMAEAIYQALTDETFRARCRSFASTVGQRFSAETMVEQTIAAYERAVALHTTSRRSPFLSSV
jgi:glycosyltransferase involved in cell wall biosynthesis